MTEEVKLAAEIVKQGGVIVFPTDTAFGIGARLDNEEAVERIFHIKGRETSKAVPLLFDSVEMVKDYVEEIPQKVEHLIEKYWPGALTIVLKANKEKVPSSLRGGGETIGVRIPDQSELLQLITWVGVPIIGTSANFSGASTVFNSLSLDPALVGQVDYVLKGNCKGRKSSTVIDVTSTPWKLLREGVIKINQFV